MLIISCSFAFSSNSKCRIDDESTNGDPSVTSVTVQLCRGVLEQDTESQLTPAHFTPVVDKGGIVSNPPICLQCLLTDAGESMPALFLSARVQGSSNKQTDLAG